MEIEQEEIGQVLNVPFHDVRVIDGSTEGLTKPFNGQALCSHTNSRLPGAGAAGSEDRRGCGPRFFR